MDRWNVKDYVDVDAGGDVRRLAQDRSVIYGCTGSFAGVDAFSDIRPVECAQLSRRDALLFSSHGHGGGEHSEVSE